MYVNTHLTIFNTHKEFNKNMHNEHVCYNESHVKNEIANRK